MVEEKKLSWAELEAQLEEEKQRKVRAFLTYMKMAEDAKRLMPVESEDEKKRERFILASIMQNYLQETLTIHAQLKSREGHIRNFFTRGETPQQAASRRALLESMNVKESEFFALALATHSEKANFPQQAMDIFRGKGDSGEEMERLRQDGTCFTEKALVKLKEGKPEWMETLLLSGLRIGCQQFSGTQDPLCAMHWARHIDSILGIVNTHPVLFHNGLQNSLLKKAVECAAIGKVMENGYDALLEFQHAAVTGSNLTPERSRELTGRILLMQDMDLKRTAMVGSLFSLAPREDFPSELLRTMQEKILSCSTLNELAKYPLTEQVLFLSGHATRAIISRQVSHELEKSAPRWEKSFPTKEPPQILPSAPGLS